MTNQEIQILKEYTDRSFYGFVKLLWDSVETNPYSDNWHIEKVCNELQERYRIYHYDVRQVPIKEGYDLLFNLPPGSSKSRIISIFFPAWVWLKRPSTKFICSSYSYKIAEELASPFLKLVTSDLYHKLNPTFKITKSALNNIKNNRGGQRFITSTDGTITGMHADIIINDDPNNAKDIYSGQSRLTAKRFVNEILPTRFVNIQLGFTITVQQRLHPEDVSGILLEQGGKLKHISIPAINDKGESFFPARFPIKHILTFKEKLGSLSYNAQYLQQTQDAEGGIIKQQWLIEEFIEPKDVPKLTYFIDSAYGGKDSDYNSILGVYKQGNNLYLYSLELNQFEFPELINWLKKNLPDNAKVYIENKASGKSIAQTLKASTNFNVIEKNVKGDKIVRKHAVSPFFEARRIVINKQIKHKQTLIEQLILDATKNDDALDTVMHSIETLLKKATGVYHII